MAHKITKKELHVRTGYILLWFFTIYLILPVQAWIDAHVPINPFVIGLAGLLLTLYYFNLNT